LAELVGGGCSADGAAMRMWRTAQEYWGHGRRMVPRAIFMSLQFAASLVEVGLAEDRGEEIYVKGSSDYLDWVAERRLAAAEGGRKSAEKRKQTASKPQPNANQNEANTNQTQPSVSGSGSSSGSKNHTLSTHAREDQEQAGPGEGPLGGGGNEWTPDYQAACERVWVETMVHFQTHRPVMMHERPEIQRAIRRYGHVPVMYALFGMRFEEPTKTFDPKKYLKLQRCFDPKLFDKFVNLGAQERERERREEERLSISREAEGLE
jgi:hypothetical protein